MASDRDPFEIGADVHFTNADNLNWRDELVDDDDPDDEPMTHTPEDVVAILGFDPLELNDEPDEEDPTGSLGA